MCGRGEEVNSGYYTGLQYPYKFKPHTAKCAMRKEAAIAIFFGAIMLLSTAGFALISATYQTVPTTPEKQEVPSVVERQLSRPEVASLLQAGRVVVEHSYANQCEGCVQDSLFLKQFAAKYPNFITVSTFAVQYENQTAFTLIGRSGQIIDLEQGLEQEAFLDKFCSLAFYQPSECVLRTLATTNKTNSSNDTIVA